MAVKRQVIAGVATLAALYVGVSNALGLGEMRLDSSLNQPLSATIQLQGAEGLSPSDVMVSLANPDAFEKAGIERPFFLTDLKFVPVVENNRLFIRVESSRPVREPYLNFLVELRRPNGRMLREYTVLLDPPLYDPQSSVAAQTAPRSAPVPAPARPRTEAASAAPASQRDLPDMQPASGAQQYTTVAGDNLWDIAARHRPDSSIPIQANMLAIRALNPQAFIDGDANRLRQNQTLTLPTPEQLVRAGAPADVVAAAVPEQPTRVAPQPTPEPQQPVVARPEEEPEVASEPTAVADATEAPDARLRIEETGIEAAESDSAELLSRLRSLESRFNVLLSELDARDAQIASLQAELEVLRQAREAETDETLVGLAAPGSLGGSTPGSGPSSPTGSDSPAPGSVAANVLPGEAAPAAESTPSASSWMSWLTLPLVLIAFLFGLLLARRRSAEPVPEQAYEEEPEEREVDGPGGFSSNITTVPAMVARPVAQQPAKTSVDALDGVELYITYGRFAEARTMLDKAIDEEPDRLDLRYKQLRVLAELGDAAGFTEQEEEVTELGGDLERVDQIKMRFPLLFDENGDMVPQVTSLEPIIDEEAEAEDQPEFRSGIEEEHDESSTSQLNLNDFTLDPDWDLIEGMGPDSARKGGEKEPESTKDFVKDEDFESSLHEFPEVEELEEDHDDHFSPATSESDDTRRDK